MEPVNLKIETQDNDDLMEKHLIRETIESEIKQDRLKFITNLIALDMKIDLMAVKQRPDDLTAIIFIDLYEKAKTAVSELYNHSIHANLRPHEIEICDLSIRANPLEHITAKEFEQDTSNDLTLINIKT